MFLAAPYTLDDHAAIGSGHFYIPAHRRIFESIQAAWQADPKADHLDIVAIGSKAMAAGDSDDLSAIEAISEFQPDETHFEKHVRELQGQKARRMALELAGKLVWLSSAATDARELVEATSSPVTAIHDEVCGLNRRIDTRAILEECMEDFRALVQGERISNGMQTSLDEINRRFGGLHPGHSIIVSGYPGGGKSALAGQLLLDTAGNGENSLFCNLEMTGKQLMNRNIAYVAGIKGKAVTDPLTFAREEHGMNSPRKGDLDDIRNAILKIKDLPYAIEDMIGADVFQICATIRRAHRRKPLRVVAVDYVQRIRSIPAMARESREQQLSHAANMLADLAKEFGFCLILPSQLNKEGAAKHAEAINEAADLHLSISQDTKGTPQKPPTFEHFGIGVPKDRHHGQSGELLPIVLNGPMVKFVEKPRY